MWTEHRNPEGRTYWFDTTTKQSVWEKPDDLKSPFERALNQTKWKEYFSGGRKYYYNTESKESKWDMPDELLLLLEKVEKEGQPPVNGAPRAITAPGFTPVGGASTDGVNQANGTSTAVGPHTGGPAALPLAANSILPARPNLPDDPVIPHNGFQTVEEGEKAFTHLLRKAGVDANWTWDQTMRAIITDPLYKALNTLAEKKACWERYTTGLQQKEQEEKEARLAKLRPALRNMLNSNPNVFYYTTFRTADKLFARHPIWQQAKIEVERKLIFEEYVAELKEREVAETRASRTRAIAKVVNLFKELNVDVVTRWRDAHDRLLKSDEWEADPELGKLPSLDILLAFEDYSRVREREYDEQMRRAQAEKTRKERKTREAFKALLHELVQAGKIKARTKWKDVYPLIRDDDRYFDLLGNPGSNPLELFWDVVDGFDQQLEKKIGVVEGVIKAHNEQKAAEREKEKARQEAEEGEDKMDVEEQPFAVLPDTTWEQFSAVVNVNASEEALQGLAEEDLKLVYDTLHTAALKKQADEKRRAERKQRHLQDDLRYAMKKLPIDITSKYEDVVPIIEALPEFKALEDEDGRKAAFSKFVKRQKEKLRETGSEDGGSVTSRKRKEPPRDYRDDERERDRERDRGDKDRREKDSHRDRDRERDKDRGKDYERSSRSSRHHRYDEYDERRSSRDYDRDKDREREKDREYKSSKYHRDGDRDRDEKKRDKEKEKDKDRDRERRERSGSVGKKDEREKPDKRARYDEPMDVDKKAVAAREETPEEGEI